MNSRQSEELVKSFLNSIGSERAKQMSIRDIQDAIYDQCEERVYRSTIQRERIAFLGHHMPKPIGNKKFTQRAYG